MKAIWIFLLCPGLGPQVGGHVVRGTPVVFRYGRYLAAAGGPTLPDVRSGHSLCDGNTSHIFILFYISFTVVTRQ